MNAVTISAISACFLTGTYLLVSLLRARKPAPVAQVHNFQSLLDFRGSPEDLVSGKVMKVTGVVTYRDNANDHQWSEHVLAHHDPDVEAHWFSSEADGSYLYWEPAGVPPQTVPVGDDTIEFEGDNFALVRRGVAAYTSEGYTSLSQRGTCDYAVYRSGARWLLFEQYANSGIWEVADGQLLSLAAASAA